jgi:PAS domain S-box-containing protein
MVVCQDFTERKKAEEALRESEQRFASFMLHLPAAAWIKDLSGRYLYLNAEAERILAVQLSAVQGRTDAEIFPPEYAGPFFENDRRVLAEGGRLRTIEAFRQKDGIEHHSIVSKFMLPGPDGLPAYLSGVAWDITELKNAEEEILKLNAILAQKAEELDAANKELEAFNYTVAHDLRGPLNTVGLYLQTIMMQYGAKLDETCRDYLKRGYQNTQRMNQLIGVLLEFSQLSNVEPQRELVDISALAREIVEELKTSAGARRCVFRVAEGITVQGDPKLLAVVLNNLLRNAWKDTGHKEEARIEFGASEIAGKLACFVRDNGEGFAQGDAGQLFMPFQRLPGSEEFTGSGIGLATVERIIRRHGGKVWAEGEPGQGACFYFTLSAR